MKSTVFTSKTSIYLNVDDIYAQMEIDAQEGRMRIPRHFIGFHRTGL
jgi:hypothetical protein